MPPREHQLATSVLVVGLGGAGLRATIELAEAGVAVMAVGKRSPRDAHTVMASGGINAALGTVDPGDSWEQHAADTLREGYLLGDPRTVEIVARDAPHAIQDLERYGMLFDRQSDGRVAQRYFGAQTYRRTVFVGDYTGQDLQRVLQDRVEQLSIPVLTSMYVTRLLADEGAVFGAYGFDLADGSRYLIHADAVILATGGHTRIWHRTSSRRDENNGDSLRLAADAGARLRDVELVQFHPSGILEPEHAAGTLVLESARDEGGVLLNNRGERFMARYEPERMELASRDRVALASYLEIKEGRGTQGGGVWLDLSHLSREVVFGRLPRIYQSLMELQGLDVTRDPIEVAPTAHYSMGGVWVRPEDSSTDVDGLFVIGEAASGLHGANQLGGNALAELLVYGRRAGHAAAEYSSRLTNHRRSLAAVRAAEGEVDHAVSSDGDRNVRALQRGLRTVMMENAGVVRDDHSLRTGLAALGEIYDQMEDLGIHIEISGYEDLAHVFDLKSAVLAARATLECALERRETRGCHNRSDYPAPDPDLQVNLVWSADTGVRHEPVPPTPSHIAALIHDVSDEGKLLE
jgi:succinate dehydrogenase / fumarate reductase flavoprotein subunit